MISLLLLGTVALISCYSGSSNPLESESEIKVVIPEGLPIKMELNRIQSPGKSTSVGEFNRKLNEYLNRRGGLINIVHIGGSHVQAGTLSSRMREKFHGLRKDVLSPRGFFIPAKMGRSNGPDFVSYSTETNWTCLRSSVPGIEGNWGISGMNLMTEDEVIEFKIWAYDEDSICFPFDSLRLFFEGNTSSITFSVPENAEIKDLKKFDQGLFLSYTEPADTIYFRALKDYDNYNGFKLNGIQLMGDTTGIAYHALGVNGASTESFLRCDFSQMEYLNPDLVIFGLGINDSYVDPDEFDRDQYKQNYLQIMDSCRAANPDVAFLFLTNNDSFYRDKKTNINVFEVSEVMFEIAEEEGCLVWDLFEIMGGLNSIRDWQREGYAKKDGIHFTKDGYRLEADLLFQALMEYTAEY